MKYLPLLFAFYGLSVQAQDRSLFKRNPMLEYKHRRLSQDSLQNLRPLQPSTPAVAPVEPGVVRINMKGEKAGMNEKGDMLYLMQPDHMPCMVPNKKIQLNMPVAGVDNSTNRKMDLLEPRKEDSGVVEPQK